MTEGGGRASRGSWVGDVIPHPRPTGTVTFVFTDIEGSTRLLAQHPATYPDIVRAQRAIIVEEAERHGGTAVSHDGDGCFLAFGDPAAAVASMVAAQRRLIDRHWPGSVELRVRAGIHTGKAEISGDDYYGMAVHTAARVAAAAHGGQILLTEQTRRRGLAEGATTDDLGMHRLRDIAEPLHLHQLVTPGLPARFPPPRTLPIVGSLRTPPTSFVGREADTRSVIRLIREHRLVTLLGPGGIGKTRLALNVGNQIGQRFDGGVWFVDLTVTDEAASVGDVVADSIGVGVGPSGDATSAVAEALSHTEALLILDNYEHVIQAASAVSTLLDRCPGVSVLVTSRERLRLGGEHIYEVPPLSTRRHGPAVRLFCERAQAARPGFEPDAGDLEVIGRICARLDGLPLAIELAAARTRFFQPAELDARLDDRLSILSSGPRDAHARHRTIRSTIDWSYELLTPTEQDLFVRMAVFASPARVEAVEAISPEGSDIEEVLGGLVDKSLLHQQVGMDGETRVRMLELVKEYAGSLLDGRPDREELRARHAVYVTDWVEHAADEMLRDDPNMWVARMEAALADSSQAFDWARLHDPVRAVRLFAAHGYFFHYTGLTHMARRWSDQVRDIDVPDELAARRDIGTGYALLHLRELGRAREVWERALAIARRLGDGLNEGFALMSIGATYMGRPEDHESAIALVRAGIELARRERSPVLEAQGHNIVGELERVHGDDDAADAAYLAGIEVAEEIGDLRRVSMLMGNRVYTATRRGDLDGALELARSAVDIHLRHGHRNQLPWVSIAVCGTLLQLGRVEEAAVLLAAGEESARRMRYEEMPGDVIENRHIRSQLREAAGDHLPAWTRRGQAMSIDDALRQVLGTVGV